MWNRSKGDRIEPQNEQPQPSETAAPGDTAPTDGDAPVPVPHDLPSDEHGLLVGAGDDVPPPLDGLTPEEAALAPETLSEATPPDIFNSGGTLAPADVTSRPASVDEEAVEAAAAALASFIRKDEPDAVAPASPDAEEQSPWDFVPLAPKTVDETGIPEPFLRELLLKALWAYDKSNSSTLVNVLGLHTRVIDQIIEGLNREGLVEIDRSSAQAKAQFEYRLTDRGKNAAHEALDRSRYIGVAPVPVAAYNAIVEQQIKRFRRPPLDEIQNALSHLVLSERLVEVIGQAFFSRRALMVYGPSGNGKTDIVTSIARVVAGTVIIPYALYGHGQLIRVFDSDVHKSQVDDEPPGKAASEAAEPHLWAGEALRHDRRWLPVHRPTVVVGGDMGAEALDMTYDATQGVHNAPLSIVAQGGVLVIDDLGRQKISPKEILNRWVLMMEQGYDSFALGSSEIVRLPLDVTLVFSTNLTLQDLMDEAYLRRIAYKIAIPGPDKAQMLEIARRTCQRRELEWTEDAIEYLVEKCFGPGVSEPKGCYPRDVITTVIDEAEFQGKPAILDRETIDSACLLYFGIGDFSQSAQDAQAA
jgi:hypothetical protein